MHELSIAASVVDAVAESLRVYPGAKVLEVRLRVGALSSVVEDSLQFCWGIATDGTRAGRVAAGGHHGSGNGSLRGLRGRWRPGESSGLSLLPVRGTRKRRARRPRDGD